MASLAAAGPRRSAAATALLIAALPGFGLGQGLKAFETQATEERPKQEEPEKPASARSSSPSALEEAGGSALGEVFLLMVKGAFAGAVYGGLSSWQRVVRETAPPGVRLVVKDDSGLTPREEGDALLPFARIDPGYRAVEGGAHDLDIRAEVGYAMAGLQLRHDRLWEGSSRDTLRLTSIHPLYRMSFGNHVELDLGPGVTFLSGQRKHEGFSWTMPLSIQPWRSLGAEFRPAWHKLGGGWVKDYELVALFGLRHVSVRLGYRWLRAGSASLDGPVAGLSLRY